MMESFFEDLKEQDAECNVPADERKLILNNRQLKENGFPEVPAAWLDLLKTANGIWLDCAEIYGVRPDKEGFRDIFSESQDVIWEHLDGGLLLGENEDDLLLFDGQKYLIVDKIGENIWHKTEDAETAARFILKL